MTRAKALARIRKPSHRGVRPGVGCGDLCVEPEAPKRGTNEASKNFHTKYIHTLAKGMDHDEDPLRLSDISRVPAPFVSLFSLYFLSSLAIHKLARLENHRVYIEALFLSQVRRGKKEYIG